MNRNHSARPDAPFLDGVLGKRAASAVDAIAADLRALNVDEIEEASLFGGHAGIALFFVYLARSKRGRADDRRYASEHLARALAQLGDGGPDPSFGSGLSGVAWTLAHLGRIEGRERLARPLEAVDRLIGRSITSTPWAGLSGFWEGLAGMSLYLLERRDVPSARATLRALLAVLQRLATRDETGTFWVMPPGLYAKRAEGDGGTVESETNLGVAHGVPGIVAVLARVELAGVSIPRLPSLIADATTWIEHQRLADGRFPYALCADRAPEPARLAWCYGEAGIASALHAAGMALGDERLCERALMIALDGACRDDDSGVEDGCLCHGAAGVAHALHRLYESSGREPLRTAANVWFERLLAIREPGRWIGGFFGAGTVANADTRKHRSADLMNGSAGIGLVLLSAITPDLPLWDRCVLMDVQAGPD